MTATISRKAKQELPDEVLNKLVEIVLGVPDVKSALKLTFSKDEMKTRQVVQKYLEAKMGDELRKYVYVKKCSKIRKETEETLNEDTLITILRAVLKMKNYKLVSTCNKANSWRYYIDSGPK